MQHSAILFALQSHMRETFWISYGCWCLMEIWIFARDRRGASGEKKDYGSVFINIVLITAGNTLAFMAPFMWPSARIALPSLPMFYAAVALIWIGIALRLWAVFTLGRQFRDLPGVLDAKVANGVQNPVDLDGKLRRGLPDGACRGIASPGIRNEAALHG